MIHQHAKFQAISAMRFQENAWKRQISGYSSNALWRKSPKTQNLTCFTKLKWRQNEEHQQTITKT